MSDEQILMSEKRENKLRQEEINNYLCWLDNFHKESLKSKIIVTKGFTLKLSEEERRRLENLSNTFDYMQKHPDPVTLWN